jgi:hypothetical protein
MFSMPKSTIDRIVIPGPVKLKVEAKARKSKRADGREVMRVICTNAAPRFVGHSEASDVFGHP